MLPSSPHGLSPLCRGLSEHRVYWGRCVAQGVLGKVCRSLLRTEGVLSSHHLNELSQSMCGLLRCSDFPCRASNNPEQQALCL